jgi:predicted dehydrogenase
MVAFRIDVIGCGFFGGFNCQLWRDRLSAIYNADPMRAEAAAKEFSSAPCLPMVITAGLEHA